MQSNTKPKFAEFDVVRVTTLKTQTRWFDGTGGGRAPRVGEIGAIVDVQIGLDGLHSYTVESVLTDGTTLWISDFNELELEVHP
jgi:hypothetical protein